MRCGAEMPTWGKEELALVRVQLHQQLAKSRGDPSLEDLPSPAPLEVARPHLGQTQEGPRGVPCTHMCRQPLTRPLLSTAGLLVQVPW